MRGCFISLEGIEGVGKSTAMRYIDNLLQSFGVSTVLTREPGGTPIAESIREVLLTHHAESMCPETELLLLFAGRAQNIKQVIEPALHQGQWVLADRFVDASYAYQGGGRGISADKLDELAEWIVADLSPDLTILLDMDVTEALQRVHSRGEHKDRFENEKQVFFQRVRDAYLHCAQRHPERFCIVDASNNLKEVEQKLADVIESFCRDKGVI